MRLSPSIFYNVRLARLSHFPAVHKVDFWSESCNQKSDRITRLVAQT